MRILFYLPVVTPWWFDNIVIHLIERLAREAEVHVLAPPLWRGTGVGADQLQRAASLEGVRWHIVSDETHPSLRTNPADPDGLVEFVRSIAPDFTLCRSADLATPRRFPGQVFHLSESGAPPFPLPTTWVTLQPDFWHHGAMPELAQGDRAVMEEVFAPAWQMMEEQLRQCPLLSLSAEEARTRLGLPKGRKVLALPVEYAHEENFFRIHHAFDRSIDLIEEIAARLGDDLFLAITDHPLNHLYVDNRALEDFVRSLGDRARLIDNSTGNGAVTNLLVRHCDGLVVQNSKTIYAAAAFAKPILRLSRCSTAPWMRASSDIDAFFASVRASGAPAPGADDARAWFALHALHALVDPRKVTGPELLDRLKRPFSVERLIPGLEQLRHAGFSAAAVHPVMEFS